LIFHLTPLFLAGILSGPNNEKFKAYMRRLLYGVHEDIKSKVIVSITDQNFRSSRQVNESLAMKIKDKLRSHSGLGIK
jgi:hypothetical protein